MEYLIICSLWIAYCAFHSFLISIKFTNIVSRVLKNYYAFYRLFYIIISLVLLIPLIQYSDSLSGKILVEYSSPWSAVRIVLMYGSLLLFFWAFFFDYDALSFFGIRQIMNFGKTSVVNASDTIKKKGLLGIIRHPMYLALIVYLWTQTFQLKDILINTILTAYVIIGTYLEERKLVLEFGDAYVKYQHEVPMLIPFIKPKTA
ncbi:MAG: protein-S-isoprenylcysteine methyltransferase [Ignavibacteriaceae bacterium]|nr:protein-S-isoprenylcysteine methyltransferase [Ignavibacteriaceae bacterium]